MSYEKLTSSSPEAQSESPVADHVNALASLFPSVVREGKVDFDALRQMLGDDVAKDDELFGLQWKGKAQARRAAITPSLGTLRPCKEESVDWDTTKNLYLEGDNLEVLKLLRKSYAGKVKMIYIDPPYNTGKEFVYPDNYQNGIEEYKKLTGQQGRFKANAETSGRYHTDWLNMMYPRLMLAKDFLKEDGVIFISIDDKEVSNIRNILNEIFGESNFIALLPTIMNLKGNQDEFAFAGTHEYTIVYAKNKGKSSFYQFHITEEELGSWIEDEYGWFKQGANLKATGQNAPKQRRPNLFFPIYVGSDLSISLERRSDSDIEIYPTTNGQDVSWRWSREKFSNNLHDVIVLKKEDDFSFYKKQRPQLGELPSKKPKTLFYKPEYSSGNGTASHKLLFGKKLFDAPPKPPLLIQDFLEIGTKDDDLILDFFSGSATTAHSTMSLNIKDEGRRNFILIQLPEFCEEGSNAQKAGFKNICEIGKERIRRAGKKIKEEAGLQGQHLDIGFRVYKLDSSNLRVWNPEVDDLELALGSHEKHLLPGRTQEDLLYEILLKQGIELTEDARFRDFEGKHVYSLGHGQYYACMETVISSEQIESLALGIVQWKNEESPDNTQCAVFVIDEAFRSDADKLNFAKILEQHGIPSVKAL
ncbi:site-specific DNA-methyltransferase [Akkermansia muciniphila]|uniref:site-specific DNA-methyltransferase n=1 Tax=Akkermansia muciniphila TaxID=239935 RepID=UPI000FE152DF|nr:site-specific DNA-methyltransferase [Akkermansia muciniphila]QAA37862.1 site-specific DNA-methyltransferase [Akkermansia muciniphila]